MASFGKLVYAKTRDHEQEFALSKAQITLGRGSANDIVLQDSKVSRTHAQLECSETGCSLIDLQSVNGTRINGAPVDRAPLKPGDLITVGDSVLRFETTAPRVDPDVVVIHSEADLEATIAQTTLATAVRETNSPRLVVHTPSRTWEVPFSQGALTIGRSADNDISLDFTSVSRHHARVERRGDAFVLRDLDSMNGTWIGDQRVQESPLQDGETFRVGQAQIQFRREFDVQDLTVADAAPAHAADGGAHPPVVIVPGLMGSQLWRGSERVWPNVRMLFSHPEIYKLPGAQPLEPRGLLGEMVIVPNLVKLEEYNRLGDFLQEAMDYQRGKDLLEFAYDWRQDVRDSACLLAQAIEGWPVKPPLTLIAHSLGCLVSRYYVERLGGKEKVGRLLLVGGPHAGAPKALTSLLMGPDLLPFGLLGQQLREVLATMPSMYEILPTYPFAVDQKGERLDLLSDEAWLPERQRALMRSAREFRKELGMHSSVPTVSIFGYGLKTIIGANVQRDGQGSWKKVNLDVEMHGDTTIPEVSAVLPGSEIHPVQQYHGSLYVDNDVKMRLKLELTKANG